MASARFPEKRSQAELFETRRIIEPPLAALQHQGYNLLILCYDNESYANTDIQVSGSSPWGVNTTFSPPGKKFRIMNRRWKKNMAAMLAAGTRPAGTWRPSTLPSPWT